MNPLLRQRVARPLVLIAGAVALILGLTAAATAMRSDAPGADRTSAEPARIPLDERNPAASATAARSARLDFSEADRIDDDELNDILWRAIRNTDPPAPVRSYFSR